MRRLILCACLFFSFSVSATENQKTEDFKEALKRIIVKAQHDWPDNYSMQAAQVKMQLVAMREMEVLESKTLREAQ